MVAVPDHRGVRNCGAGCLREKTASKRLTKEDWLRLGLARLSAHGPSTLTLEQICEAAGKTKGSFYHHFSDHAAFLSALVQEWRRMSTLALIEAAEAMQEPQAKLRRLNRLVMEIDEPLERGVRLLADQEPRLRPSLTAVDEERIAYMAELYRRSAPEIEGEAALIAQIEYAAFIGHLVIWPNASRKQRAEAAKAFEQLVQGAYANRK